jgi:hypothetical protein
LDRKVYVAEDNLAEEEDCYLTDVVLVVWLVLLLVVDMDTECRHEVAVVHTLEDIGPEEAFDVNLVLEVDNTVIEEDNFGLQHSYVMDLALLEQEERCHIFLIKNTLV